MGKDKAARSFLSSCEKTALQVPRGAQTPSSCESLKLAGENKNGNKFALLINGPEALVRARPEEDINGIATTSTHPQSTLGMCLVSPIPTSVLPSMPSPPTYLLWWGLGTLLARTRGWQPCALVAWPVCHCCSCQAAWAFQKATEAAFAECCGQGWHRGAAGTHAKSFILTCCTMPWISMGLLRSTPFHVLLLA